MLGGAGGRGRGGGGGVETSVSECIQAYVDDDHKYLFIYDQWYPLRDDARRKTHAHAQDTQEVSW